VPSIENLGATNDSLQKKGSVKTHNENTDKEPLAFVGLCEVDFRDVFEAALHYCRRDIPVTPLFGKRPILKGWQYRRFSEDDLPRFFGYGHNVGVVLGGLTGIVDVDLDNPVAVAVADLLLPDSMESGREKSPRSHRWFISDPTPPSRRYCLTKSMAARLMVEPAETTLIELRGTGQLTMVPPSIHPVSGDRCLWYPSVICGIGGEELASLVLEVAVATLLAINHPLGSRTSFAISTAGYLCPRFGAGRAERIVEAASMAFDDEEHDERMQAARSSLREPIVNDPTIDTAVAEELERLAPGVPDLICRWCRRNRRGSDRGGVR
jgi:hypothetical protein